MKRIDSSQEFKWDLEKLYPTDEQFLKDLDIYIAENNKLLLFEGKLNNQESFLDFLNKSFETNKLISKINHFLKILHVEQNNERVENLESIYNNKMQQFDGKFSWISEEIKQIGENNILQWLENDKKLKPYQKSYKDFFKHIKYLLPQEQRELISKLSNSSSIIYEMYESMRFKDNEKKFLNYNNKQYEINQQFISELLTYSHPEKDQEFRALASLKYKENMKSKKHTFTKIFESIIKEEIESAQMVGMKSYKENFFDEDDFRFEDFQTLMKFSSNYSEIYHNYYQILKEHFNLKKFYSTDSSLQLINLEKESFSIEKGKEIILNSLSILGEEYIKNLKYCWSDNRIDYFEDENKSTGAFTIGSYKYDSLISLNWTDDIDSISTLTHELGHAVHNLFAKQNQPKPLNGFSNIIAEVASTLNEHLLFDYLFSQEKNNDKKIMLLQNRIEFIFSNFFLAIREAKFEYACYEFVEQNGVLTNDKIVEFFRNSNKNDLQKKTFDIYDKSTIEYNWIAISHIFEQPFYIYKYAVSIAVSYQLYWDFKKTNDPTNIINFLKEGGNLEPVELFKKYGFDCQKKESYFYLIKNVEEMVKNIKELLIK